MAQPNYNMPVTHNANHQPGMGDVANNQLALLQATLKNQSSYITCPHCRNSGLTRVEKKTNGCGCYCFTCFLGLWLCSRVCNDEPLTFKDAEHYCSSCGNKVASYKACC